MQSAFAGFFGAGQSGIGSMRVLVQADILEDEFLDRLNEKAQEITKQMGAPMNPDSVMGSMASLKQLKKLDELVQEASATETMAVLGEGGDRQLTGISPLDGFDFSRGAFYTPTVLSWGLDRDMLDKPIWHQERCGPLVYLIAFGTEEEAIKLVNDDPFGHGASIWTENQDLARRVSDRIERGTVRRNTHHLIDPSSQWLEMQLATGGHENCLETYQSYTTTKTTFTNSALLEESWVTDDWFPSIYFPRPPRTYEAYPNL